MSIRMVVRTSCIALLAVSVNATAGVISYAGYTRDTNTNIINGHGVDWLSWDVTVNESFDTIQSQLDTLEGGGWQVATYTDMAGLFNIFDFGVTFDTRRNDGLSIDTGFSVGEPDTEVDRIFLSMFGDTYAAGGGSNCYAGECYEYTSAYFRSSDRGSISIHQALVRDDYINQLGNPVPGLTAIYADEVTSNTSSSQIGFALIRNEVPPPAVPVPAAVWLFGSGLIALAGIARRKSA